MERLSLALAALAALLVAPTVAAADLSQEAPPECVQYMYVADYHWYWVCADPKDLSCPLYFKEQHGVSVTTRCAVEPPATSGMAPEPSCIPTSGGLDYPSFLCVDAGNPRCAVYTLTSSDWGVRKTCVPGI